MALSFFTLNASLKPSVLPLITICELHVHRVAAEKGLGVQRGLDVGGMGNGVTDQDQVWDRRIFVAICLLSVVVINTNVT